jgi:hypothetical protein
LNTGDSDDDSNVSDEELDRKQETEESHGLVDISDKWINRLAQIEAYRSFEKMKKDRKQNYFTVKNFLKQEAADFLLREYGKVNENSKEDINFGHETPIKKRFQTQIMEFRNDTIYYPLEEVASFPFDKKLVAFFNRLTNSTYQWWKILQSKPNCSK